MNSRFDLSKGHENDIYVLEAHPDDPRLLLSAGNEGFVFLWNILTGKLIKKFVNKVSFLKASS